MTGLVDLHAHVLPGIDDGPPNLDAAVTMLKAAANAGTAVIAATPHVRSDFPDVHIREIARRCSHLQDAATNAGIDIQIVPGAELSLVWALEATDEELKLTSYGQKGNILLIETPSDSVIGFSALLHRLRTRGFRVLLAHPERSADYQQDPQELLELVEQGVLLQVNADALLARRRNSPAASLGHRLCSGGFAHVLASDGHRAESWRPVTRLAQASEAAANLCGRARARWMTETLPKAILEGTALPPEPLLVKRQPRWRPWA